MVRNEVSQALVQCGRELHRLPQALQMWADTALQDSLADPVIDSEVRRQIAAVIGSDIFAVARSAGAAAEKSAAETVMVGIHPR